MSTLRPPSTSPSPSPSPSNPTNGTAKPANSRASMGRPANLSPISPRPAGTTRPASELLGSGPAFQTPESEAIDQWFENLQTYEATLEEMAAASLDANFKEELSSIEQWFNVLSEAERTAALYSLLQSATQVQIRFFITVLQQMARSDPTSAVLLSPGPTDQSPMQTALDAKLASMGLKSPGLKQSAPLSPVARSFSNNANPSLLSSDAAMVPSTGGDAAATLAQQRAKLKANNAHRISAPVTMSHSPDGRNIWSPPQLGQVAERVPSPSPPAAVATESASPSPAQATSTVRPKSTDLSGVANSFRGQAAATSEGQELTAPAASGSWASQVNTPLVPIFGDGANEQAKPTVDGAAKKLQTWSNGKSATSPTQSKALADGTNHLVLDDARKFRKVSGAKSAYGGANDRPANMNIYGDDGNLALPSVAQPGTARSTVGVGSKSPNWRSPNPNPAPAPSEQMTFGMGLPNGNMFNAANGGMDMQALLNSGMFGMGMGVNPIQAQLLAAQIAAGQFAYPAMGLGMTAPMRTGARSTRGAASVRTSATSTGGSIREEDITLDNLQDIPNWLRSLRLHKYTGNFEGMTWQQIVMLDDAQLEAKGVAALGARRKMLKVFDLVKAKMGTEL